MRVILEQLREKNKNVKTQITSQELLTSNSMLSNYIESGAPWIVTRSDKSHNTLSITF